MLTVRCPRCRHDQLYDPKIGLKSPTVVGKKKRCVYCGMTFSVHSDQTRTNIVWPSAKSLRSCRSTPLRSAGLPH